MVAAIGVEANRRTQSRTAEKDIAAGGAIEAAEQVKQGRLPATAVSADGDELASVDGKIDTPDGLDTTLVVIFAQIAYFQNGTSYGAPPRPKERRTPGEPGNIPAASLAGARMTSDSCWYEPEGPTKLSNSSLATSAPQTFMNVQRLKSPGRLPGKFAGDNLEPWPGVQCSLLILTFKPLQPDRAIGPKVKAEHPTHPVPRAISVLILSHNGTSAPASSMSSPVSKNIESLVVGQHNKERASPSRYCEIEGRKFQSQNALVAFNPHLRCESRIKNISLYA